MRITSQLLRSRASRPLHSVDYLDLSNLGLVSLERLELCPKLQTVILRGNKIESAPDLRICSQLWKIDLANNVVRSLEGLYSVVAFGTLILANNDLDWNELEKIRHVHILDLCLHGNPRLEIDAYYRMHVIDSLPLIWMLDGRIITSAERAQVNQFFKDSALSERPVRHKLSKNQFVPSLLKNISVTGVFGKKAEHLMRRFPVKEKLNVDLDQRRLMYLTYCLQEEVNLVMKNMTKGRVAPSQLIVNLINYRNEDKQRCNMLLLMLVASLEFAIPSVLLQQTLDVARLRKIRNLDTMDLFMLPRDIKCRVLSLLLGAVKIERDQHIDAGFYNKLYLCLFDLVADLIRLANGDSIVQYQATRKKLDVRKTGYRCLLASEVLQLLCIVPVFYEFIGKDPGVLDLIITATGDCGIGEKMNAISWKVQSEGGGKNEAAREMAEYLLACIRDTIPTISGKRTKCDSRLAKDQLQCDNSRVRQPSYVITSKRIVKASNQGRPQTCVGSVWSKLQRCEMSTKRGNKAQTTRAASAVGLRTTGTVAAQQTKPKLIRKKPVLGDKVEVGHQMYGRLAAIPEPNMGLVQLESGAAPKFQQADYPIRQWAEQFIYVDFRNIDWDPVSDTWKQIPYSKEFKEIKKHKEGRSASLDSRSARDTFQFLSDTIRQNLQLQMDLPVASTGRSSPVDRETIREDTVVTDHVRSIVRECLQEADVHWTSSYSSDPNNDDCGEEFNGNNRFSDGRANLVNPDFSELRINSAFSESVQDCQLSGEDSDNSSSKGTEGVLEVKTTRDDNHNLTDKLQPEIHHPSPDMDEMVSQTENARLNAWKTSEVIKKAAISRVPPRVGSATSRVMVTPSTSPPPQRPSSPIESCSVPLRPADQWLAGGRDINRASVKHVSVWLPGWMDGLESSRRPKSSPVLRGPKQPSRPVSARTLLTRPNTGRLVKSAAWVQVRGSPPPSYTRVQPLNIVLKRK